MQKITRNIALAATFLAAALVLPHAPAMAQSLEQAEAARHAFVDCLLKNNANTSSCTRQQRNFEQVIRASAFRTSRTWQNHRNAWQNSGYVENTVRIAVRDTVNLVQRGLQ